MRKVLALILILAVVLSLSACFGPIGAREKKEDVTFKRNGFSVTLPAGAKDTSIEEEATEIPYLFMADDIIITAMELKKDDFLGLSLEEFAQLLISANGFDTTLTQKDGLFAYTYVDDGDTMMSIVLETEDRFWFVSATCEERIFEKLQDTMWEYLQTVQVSDY